MTQKLIEKSGEMAQRVPWDMSEAVIMLNALIAAREGRISRKDAIESVSSELRTRAKRNGVEVDDIFRNVNGITLQMSTMEYIVTNGEKGMKKSPMPKLFQEAVTMYRNDRVIYEKTLRAARNMTDAKSIQDQYFTWLATQVSPAQLSELYVIYADIEDFCLNRSVIKKKLFALTCLADIRKVMDTVDSNKVFRFTYKRNLSKMRSAMQFYYRFMKEHPELLDQAIPGKPAEKPAPVEAKPVKPTPESVKQREIAVSSAVDIDVNQIDFNNVQSLAFTQPTEFSYFGEEQAKVNSWTQLYVQVVNCLLDDYPGVLHSYINRNIGGRGRYDFTDESGMSNMTAPKKVQHNFYLETNISATDIAGKIKKLLDMCNVDYENLEVYYQKRGSIAPTTIPTPRTDNCTYISGSESIKEQFISWMQQTGSATGTIHSYVTAIGQSSKAANEYGICDTDLFLIEDANKLQQILTSLLDVPAFRELNAQQHNRFRAALSKLVTYRSCLGTVSAYTQPEVKTPILKVAEPVANSQGISDETRIRYTEILSEYFGEDGYQPGRAIFRGRFKRFYTEEYGCDPAETDDRIDEIMSMVGTKRDGRIFPKQDDGQNDLITKIINDILSAFDSGATAVYIEAVYDRYQQPLADNLHIYNQDALASLLLGYANGRYAQRYAFLTNSRSDANAQEDLLRIMKAFHQPQDYAAIHKKAWFLPFERMKTILATTPSIVNVAAETYFYAPNLPVSAEELTHLSLLINEELNDHSHITDVRLMQLIAEKCPSIAINTDGYTTYGLRNCFGYILRDQFAFNGPIITLKGEELSMADVFAEFAKDHKVLHVDELSALSNEMNIVIYWDSVLSEMIRVSATELVRKDQIKFDVAAIDEILEGMCPSAYVPLPEVNLFLYFPNVGYPWNSYLLESYLFSYSRKFRLLHSSFIKTGVYGAMVRKDANIPDYRSLLVDVLSKSNALDSTKMALQYIVDKGYQQRRRYEGINMVLQEAKLIKEQREKREK